MARGVATNVFGTVVAIAGGVTSIALLLAAAQNTPTLLLVLFVGWVALPFVVLVIANRYVLRWSTRQKFVLTMTTVCISITSVLIYGYFTIWPLSVTPARTWLLAPAVSLVLIATLRVAAYFSHRRAG
jgi:hypothetical protein